MVVDQFEKLIHRELWAEQLAVIIQHARIVYDSVRELYVKIERRNSFSYGYEYAVYW